MKDAFSAEILALGSKFVQIHFQNSMLEGMGVEPSKNDSNTYWFFFLFLLSELFAETWSWLLVALVDGVRHDSSLEVLDLHDRELK